MTRQEIFDKVWDWFVRRRHKQSRNSHDCLYRGPNGAKCAAGVLILDEYYDPACEGCGVFEVHVADILKRSGMQEEDHAFVTELQHIHDRWYADSGTPFRVYMKEQLEALAFAHKLHV